MNLTPIQILMVEDNDGDVLLDDARRLRRPRWPTTSTCACTTAWRPWNILRRQGKYATAPRPDLILLDLNLPRKDGRQVLEEIKPDPELRTIPVVVLTSSSAEADVVKSYDLHANCYIVKPVDFHGLMEVVKSIEQFWLTVVKLPSAAQNTVQSH